MKAKKKPPTKRLNVNVPTELYDMYAKLCIDWNVSLTEGIIRYFKYLEKTKWMRKTGDDTINMDE